MNVPHRFAGLAAGSARTARTVRAARGASTASAALCSAALLLAPSPDATADEAILVGGGYSPLRSEAQIELNAAWIGDVLRRAGLYVTTYYTDGDAGGDDVVSLEGGDAPPSPLEPLARAFGELDLERTRRRQHTLPDVAGPTSRDVLEPALESAFAAAQAADESVLLVYNGHGSQSVDGSPAGVSLNLWDDTAMYADELHALLEGHTAPVRWVFTQCYSGGFHRLAYRDPDEGIALAEGQRCGFTAESAYRLAEGCSASIDTDDYRDYSTYLFAALDARERDGDVLGADPDVNADGTTTPREAHLYALGHAWSSDLSRSTSEDWLDAWQPWWLRWLPQPARVPENEYAKLYRDLSARIGFALDGGGPTEIRAAMGELQDRLDGLVATRTALREREATLGGAIVDAVVRRRPALLGPYTTAYRDLVVAGGLEDVARSIESMPDYAALVEAQDEDAALDTDLIEAERALVQHAKLLRFRRLATLVDQLERRGSEDERAAYAGLVACEELPLAPEPAASDIVRR